METFSQLNKAYGFSAELAFQIFCKIFVNSISSGCAQSFKVDLLLQQAQVEGGSYLPLRLVALERHNRIPYS